jgi:hypothetical protein
MKPMQHPLGHSRYKELIHRHQRFRSKHNGANRFFPRRVLYDKGYAWSSLCKAAKNSVSKFSQTEIHSTQYVIKTFKDSAEKGVGKR